MKHFLLTVAVAFSFTHMLADAHANGDFLLEFLKQLNKQYGQGRGGGTDSDETYAKDYEVGQIRTSNLCYGGHRAVEAKHCITVTRDQYNTNVFRNICRREVITFAYCLKKSAVLAHRNSVRVQGSGVGFDYSALCDSPPSPKIIHKLTVNAYARVGAMYGLNWWGVKCVYVK